MNFLKYDEDCYTLENLTHIQMEVIATLINNVNLGGFTDASNACEEIAEVIERAKFYTTLDLQVEDSYTGEIIDSFGIELV